MNPDRLRAAIERIGIEKDSDYTLVMEEVERMMDADRELIEGIVDEVSPGGEISPGHLREVAEKALAAGRERIASELFNRPAFMTAVAGDGKPYVKIEFGTMKEMHEFHGALVDLSKHKRHGCP